MAYIPIKAKPKLTKPFGGRMNPFYNSRAWRRLSHAYRQANPLCEECKRSGRIKQAQVVDHIIPIRVGGDPYDMDNLQRLCAKCHNKTSGQEAAIGSDSNGQAGNESFNDYEKR